MSDEPFFKTLHPFVDRSVRFLFRRPERLRALVKLCRPELEHHLDFSRAERIDKSFVSDEYREREADLLFRVPFRNQPDAQPVVVYLLVEHQSTVDEWMPLRLLQYMLSFWDAERLACGNGPAALSAIIPLLFCTGSKEWKASRDFRTLIRAPESVLKYAPTFDILYSGLPETAPAALEGIGPLGWALRALQRIEASQPEFSAVVARAAKAISAIIGEEWGELAEFLLRLVAHYRSTSEMGETEQAFREAAQDPNRQLELTNMIQTAVEAWRKEGWQKGVEEGREVGREEGREEGREVGREEGREVGRLVGQREVLLRLGLRRFGPPTAAQRSAIEAITSADRIEALADAVLDRGSWDDLFREL